MIIKASRADFFTDMRYLRQTSAQSHPDMSNRYLGYSALELESVLENNKKMLSSTDMEAAMNQVLIQKNLVDQFSAANDLANLAVAAHDYVAAWNSVQEAKAKHLETQDRVQRMQAIMETPQYKEDYRVMRERKEAALTKEQEAALAQAKWEEVKPMFDAKITTRVKLNVDDVVPDPMLTTGGWFACSIYGLTLRSPGCEWFYPVYTIMESDDDHMWVGVNTGYGSTLACVPTVRLFALVNSDF